MSRFPRILAAWRQIALDQWELGDALEEHLAKSGLAGGRGTSSVNDGSRTVLLEVAQFLKPYGFEHDVGYLARLWNAAATFKGRDRRKDLSWSTHYEAGTPEVLKAVIAKIGDDKPTRDVVRETRRELEGRQHYPRAVERKEEPRGASPRLKPTISHECNALKDRVEANLEDFDQPYIDVVAEQLMDITEYCRKASVRMKRDAADAFATGIRPGAVKWYWEDIARRSRREAEDIYHARKRAVQARTERTA